MVLPLVTYMLTVENICPYSPSEHFSIQVTSISKFVSIFGQNLPQLEQILSEPLAWLQMMVVIKDGIPPKAPFVSIQPF